MLRIFAHFISILFHPLLMLTYMLVLLMLINPYTFGVPSIEGNIPLILLVFLSTFAIPAFAAFMMAQLGLIESIQMKKRTDRIGPYIITGIFYMWMFRNIMENPTIPTAYSVFVLGATIGLFIAFFINIFQKISAHAVGMGGLLGMVVITMLHYSYDDFVLNISSFGAYRISIYSLLMFVIILTGMVGTARLLLKAHHPQDLYGGYFVGFVTQFLAFIILT